MITGGSNSLEWISFLSPAGHPRPVMGWQRFRGGEWRRRGDPASSTALLS